MSGLIIQIFNYHKMKQMEVLVLVMLVEDKFYFKVDYIQRYLQKIKDSSVSTQHFILLMEMNKWTTLSSEIN